MFKLNFDEIKHISFPDFKVISIRIDIKNKVLNLSVEGIWIENKSGIGKELGSNVFNFIAWKEFQIRKNSENLTEWVNVSTENFEGLKDICEFQLLGEEIYLKGFGNQSGLWVEYKIVSPLVEASFESN